MMRIRRPPQIFATPIYYHYIICRRGCQYVAVVDERFFVPFFQGITLDAVPTSQEKTIFHCSSNMVFICACGELSKQRKFNFALAKALAIKVFSIGDNPN